MRGALLLVLAVAASHPAGADDSDIFLPPAEGDYLRVSASGARERVGETLALLGARVAKDPSDAEAWARAEPILSALGRGEPLVTRLRKTVQAGGLDTRKMVALRRVIARAILRMAGVDEEDAGAGGPAAGFRRLPNIIRIGGAAPRLLDEAIDNLRAILLLEPSDRASRRLLGLALLARGREEDDSEGRDLVQRNPTETDPDAAPLEVDPPGELLLEEAAERRRGEARRLELDPAHADHETALALRKEALVLDFCDRTIPFRHDEAVYDTVALFAEDELLQRNLTRFYIDRKGKESRVGPLLYETPPDRRMEALRKGLDPAKGSAHVAALLAILRRADSDGGSAEEAARMLERARPKEAVAGLPTLLEVAMSPRQAAHFSPAGRRFLVRLAGTLGVGAAAPTLARLAAADEDLLLPLDAATALGRCGGARDAEGAALLLRIAKDASRDVYFRRRAVDGLSLLDPVRLEELAGDPVLELAVAAGRFRAKPEEALKGRILRFLETEHEADDAARYCADLGIREAIPAIEEATNLRRDHYTAGALRSALADLAAPAPASNG